jgi:hypothetical protein
MKNAWSTRCFWRLRDRLAGADGSGLRVRSIYSGATITLKMNSNRIKHARRSLSRKRAGAPKRPEPERDRFAHLNPKLAELARKQWPEKGRAERIARAEQAWKEIQLIASTFKKLDPETLKWIAEGPDLEYM